MCNEKESNMNMFKANVVNMPDLLKSRLKSNLFNVRFEWKDNKNADMAETLRFRAKAIETSPITKDQMVQFNVTFDEFQDFKVFPFWFEQMPNAKNLTEEEFAEQSFTTYVDFYDSKLENVVGRLKFNEVNPVVMHNLNLNQEGDGKVQCKVTFMAKNMEILENK